MTRSMFEKQTKTFIFLSIGGSFSIGLVYSFSSSCQCNVRSSNEYKSRTYENLIKRRIYQILVLLFSEDFVLPREEARRLFRAYNHVWDLRLDEDRLQRVFDFCARNGNIGIDDALKLFAKQT